MAAVKDKATAFKNEIAGTQTNKIVCKAASHEIAGPKKKHVDYLLQLTNNPKCQFTILADLIGDRLKHNNWVVVFKGLILSHNLITLGNEKFLQCVATRGHMFDMDNFADKTDILSSDMSSYLRKYARYVRHICIGYKALAVDIGRIPKGEDSPFRNMDTPKLIKTSAVVQDQLDLLVEVEFVSSELSNGVINTAFIMLYKDLVKLYAVYNDAMINLLEKFFEMKKSECRETITYYRRFLLRQESVQRYLQLAESVGVDKDSHLNLRQVPEDLLPALEQHLTDMDAAKKAAGMQPSPQIQAASEKLQELREKEIRKSKVPSQSGSGIISGFPSASEDVLEAQRKRFEELKKRASEKVASPSSSSTDSSSQDKSTAAATTVTLTPPPQTVASSSSSGAGDLLSLDASPSGGGSTAPPRVTFDPWGATSAPSTSIPPAQQATPSSSNPFSSPDSSLFSSAPTSAPAPSSGDPWALGTPSTVQSSYQEIDLFSELRSGPNFDNVFGQKTQDGFSSPSTTSTSSQGGGPSSGAVPGLGGMLTPQAVGTHAEQATQEIWATQQQPLALTSDVESSLARAAANLSIDVGPSKTGFNKKADYQWKAPKESVKTGGPNFQRQNLQQKTIHAMESKNAATWGSGLQSGHFPLNSGMQQQQQPPMMGGRPMMMGGQPMMGGGGMVPQYSMGGGMGGMYQQQQQQPMGQPFMQQAGGMQGGMGVWPQQQPQQQQQQFQQNTNPFGQNPSLL